MDLAEQQSQQGTSPPADLAPGALGPQPADAEKVAPGDVLHLTLTAWGRLGEAMAEHAGQSVFVFGGIPGEQVVAEVLRVHRKYVSATVIEVVVPSPNRVEPPCPYYGQCTGCQWQHLDYETQLLTKQAKVMDALARVGGFVGPGFGRFGGVAVARRVRVPEPRSIYCEPGRGAGVRKPGDPPFRPDRQLHVDASTH